MTAEEYLDINGWPHPDSNFKNDILDSMQEFAEAYAKHVIKKALPSDELYSGVLRRFKQNLNKEGIEI